MMVRETAEGVTLAIRVQPGAKKTAISGIYGEGQTAQLKIAVHAPPVEGKANAALVEFLAGTVELTKSAVEIVSGEMGRSKLVLLRRVTAEQVRAVLGELRGA